MRDGTIPSTQKAQILLRGKCWDPWASENSMQANVSLRSDHASQNKKYSKKEKDAHKLWHA